MAEKRTPNIVIECGFEAIEANNFFRQSTLKLGKDLAESHLFNVREEKKSSGDIAVSGKCVRSTNLKEQQYHVELKVDAARKVLGGHCTCAAGIDGTCKHEAGLLHYINSQLPCKQGGKDWQQEHHWRLVRALPRYLRSLA